mgnify:CR=1 FL=1
MDISLPALVSILALVILVGISCVNEDLNVGFLGIAFGIIVGGVFAGTPASKVMNAFPLSLFMILVGVTFLFGMASDQRHYGKTYCLFYSCLQRQHCPCTYHYLHPCYFYHHHRTWQHRWLRIDGSGCNGYCFQS